jgi:hypothetical protein
MSTFVRRSMRWLGCASLLAAWLGTGSVRASVVTALDMSELVRGAEQVLVVTALSERARREARGGLIVTDVRLRVEETLKGDARAGGIVVATRLGGVLDKVALQVPGEASFTLGERALVFLRRHTNEQVSELRVLGMAQGVLPLREEAKQTMVMPSGGDVSLVARDDDGQLVAAPSAMRAARPLRELRDEIRRLVAEQASEGAAQPAPAPTAK